MLFIYNSLYLGNPNDITGRTIVIHALGDDFNPGRDPSSTGNAGARLTCGSIKAQSNNWQACPYPGYTHVSFF